MPPKKSVALVITDPKLLAARTEGIKISSPLEEMVNSLVISNQDDLLEADGLLGQIRNGRAKWRVKIDPIISPLKRAIDAAKLAMAGAKQLDDDIDGPMERLESTLKLKMADYRLEEAHLIEAGRQEKERLAAEDRRQALLKEQAAARPGVTAGMRARLDAARAALEVSAAAHEDEAEDIQPVQAANSSTRWTEKCRINNLPKFLAAMQDYTSSDGVLKMGHPPYELLRREKVMAAIQVELNKIWSATPGVIKSWPGVETFKDVNIAGR